MQEGILTQIEIEDITKKQFDYYNDELQQVESYQPEKSYFNKQWSGFEQAPSELTIWDTGVGWDLLSYVGRRSVYVPENFVSSETQTHRKFFREASIRLLFLSARPPTHPEDVHQWPHKEAG